MVIFSVAVSLVVFAAVAVTMSVFALWSKPVEVDPDLSRRPATAFVGNWLLGYLEWILRPLERALLFLGMTADRITYLSLFIAAWACLAFTFGLFSLAGILILTSGILDALDGRIARHSGHAGPKGAVLDSVTDRYSDGLIFTGLVLYYSPSPWVVLVMVAFIGAFMVSYSRARAEGVGVEADIGSMQRGERLVFLAVASLVSPLFDQMIPTAQPSYYYPVLAALTIMAISAHVTAIKRVSMVYRVMGASQESDAQYSTRRRKSIKRRRFVSNDTGNPP